jgi:hypothetical protein
VQFVVSCGVLIPPNQQTTPAALEQEIQKRFGQPELAASAAGSDNGGARP